MDIIEFTPYFFKATFKTLRICAISGIPALIIILLIGPKRFINMAKDILEG